MLSKDVEPTRTKRIESLIDYCQSQLLIFSKHVSNLDKIAESKEKIHQKKVEKIKERDLLKEKKLKLKS